MLSAMGIVESRQEDGTFIRDTISPKVINPLLFAVIIEAQDKDILNQIRQVTSLSNCLVRPSTNMTTDMILLYLAVAGYIICSVILWIVWFQENNGQDYLQTILAVEKTYESAGFRRVVEIGV